MITKEQLRTQLVQMAPHIKDHHEDIVDAFAAFGYSDIISELKDDELLGFKKVLDWFQPYIIREE